LSVYNTGNVKLRAGSSIVVGSGTSFNTHVSSGYLFKLTSEAVCYSIAAVNSATRLTLSSRYTNTSYQTARAENIASITTATRVYSGTLDHTPVIQSELTINASIEKFTDDGAGVLTGSCGGSGTVSYDDGEINITLGTSALATTNMSASYYSGDTMNSMPFQIVTDYTPHYRFPEISANDVSFPHLYTKAVRLIDSKMYSASVDTIKVVSHLKMGSHQYLLFGDANNQASVEAAATAVDASCKGSMYMSTAGTLWFMTSDNTAASVTLT